MSRNPQPRGCSEVSGFLINIGNEERKFLCFLDSKTPLIIRHTINLTGSRERNTSLNTYTDLKTPPDKDIHKGETVQ